eukprot:TRINITY_DN43966_c0_g1_i1.p1 TRINITY_DN43966_c0_g1~~TRINITY_DN43966_c0_g1_i1.p1  ORF type:complete len:337 (+),score=93.49 TRINITY_DN43966_c0_g1_i1:144-1013(+)
MLAVALNYEDSESPLNCTLDTERLVALAKKSGVKDIVKMYDTGKTEKFPCIEELKETVAEIAKRSKPHDSFVFAFSGHGGIEKKEDSDSSASDNEDGGISNTLVLRPRDGDPDASEELVDSEVAKLISSSFDPRVTVLVLVDACHSGNILNCNTPAIWSKRKVVAVSGCQDKQCSIDTGDGGAMTNTLLKILQRKTVAEMRKRQAVSIQYIFNRMVMMMPEDDEEDDEEGEEGESEEGEEDEDSEDEDDEESEEDGDEDPITGEEPEPGQTINLSWPGSCDPSRIAFPF